MLITYLPEDKCVGQNLSREEQSARVHCLFHRSMWVVLEPLIKAGLEGMEMVEGDGNVHSDHLILACYIADYPEQCLVTCSKLGTCPKCLQVTLGESSLGKMRTQSDSLSTITQVKRSAWMLREF